MPGNAKKKCPKNGSLYVEVRRQRKDNAKKWDKLTDGCALSLEGGDVDERDASTKSDTTYKNICAGAYNLLLTADGDEAGFDIEEMVAQKSDTIQDWTAVGSGAL